MTDDTKFVRVDLPGMEPIDSGSLARVSADLWRVVQHVRPGVEIDLLCAFVEGDKFTEKILRGIKPECHANGHGTALGSAYAASMLVDAVIQNRQSDDYRLKAALEMLRSFLREQRR